MHIISPWALETRSTHGVGDCGSDYSKEIRLTANAGLLSSNVEKQWVGVWCCSDIDKDVDFDVSTQQTSAQQSHAETCVSNMRIPLRSYHMRDRRFAGDLTQVNHQTPRQWRATNVHENLLRIALFVLPQKISTPKPVKYNHSWIVGKGSRVELKS